jgi:hypothetical protein
MKECTVKDPLYPITPNLSKYNMAQDVLLAINFILLFFSTYTSPISYKIYFLTIVYVLIVYQIRKIASDSVNCTIPDMNKGGRTPFDPDIRWYPISGHLLSSGMCTVLIYFNCTNSNLFRISLFLTIALSITSILIREHYTYDIVITYAILYILFIGISNLRISLPSP